MRSDRDLFDAADLWRLDYALGLTSRAEIEQLLLARLANASYRHQAVEALGHDIRTMWDRIQSAPPATAIAVDSLTGQGNDRTWFGRLTALNELEDRLLVWPTVVDGTTRAVLCPPPTMIRA